jgi:transposase InsO family protein
LRSIAREFRVSVPTVKRWRLRDSVEDRSSRPHRISTAIEEPLEAGLLELRRRELSLDEVFEAVMDEHPRLSRVSVWRLFRRNGLGRLKRPVRPSSGRFKVYAPGYVHIDSFNTPRFGSTRYYGFVAIDRATRRTHVAMYPCKGQKSGADFLRQCLQVFEFRIQRVLTDNGAEFTNRCYNHFLHGPAKRVHGFDKVCKAEGIEHRLTKPRTPKTNGLAERQVQIIKNATTRKSTYVSPKAMEEDLSDWNERNNRKRQRRLDYKSPLQVSKRWYDLEEQLFKREPAASPPRCHQPLET